jgi:hypothetical protein
MRMVRNAFGADLPLLANPHQDLTEDRDYCSVAVITGRGCKRGRRVLGRLSQARTAVLHLCFILRLRDWYSLWTSKRRMRPVFVLAGAVGS